MVSARENKRTGAPERVSAAARQVSGGPVLAGRRGALGGGPSSLGSGGEAGRDSHPGRFGCVVRAGGVFLRSASPAVLPEAGRGRGSWARRGRRSAGGRSICSAWHSGRKIRPACGAAASSAVMSESPRRYSICERPIRVSSTGTRRSSQPYPPGSRRAGAAGRGRAAFPDVRRGAESRPAWTEATSLSNRASSRRSRLQASRTKGASGRLGRTGRNRPAQQVHDRGEPDEKARCGEHGGHERKQNTIRARCQATFSRVESRHGGRLSGAPFA